MCETVTQSASDLRAKGRIYDGGCESIQSIRASRDV